jgi:hypothetical protein
LIVDRNRTEKIEHVSMMRVEGEKLQQHTHTHHKVFKLHVLGQVFDVFEIGIAYGFSVMIY